MSRTPCARSFLGIGSMPHSGMPGRAERAGILEHQDGVGRHGERRIVDAGLEVVVVLEDHRAPRVLRAAGARLPCA